MTNIENDSKDTLSTSAEESVRKAVELVTWGNRPVIRPQLDFRKMAVSFGIWILLMLGAWYLGSVLLEDAHLRSWAILGCWVLICLLHLKKAVVGSILLYQRFAPENIRAACLFEPSCSSYMLMAIEKYGVFKGVILGIRRLLRCHYPNGGVDCP